MAGLVNRTASGTINNNNSNTSKIITELLDNKSDGHLSTPPDLVDDHEENLVNKIISSDESGIYLTNDYSLDNNNKSTAVDHLTSNNFFERQRSLQNLFGKSGENTFAYQRKRSNSDGATLVIKSDAENLDQQLPASALINKMGLKNETSKDHQQTSESSLEQKFTSLALSFSIDASSINERCDRLRRKRDQNERNFNLEIDKLKSKLTFLQPLCNDFETAELLSTLFSQVDILTRAASLVTNAAERFGAVQHEKQLTESVQLMISHVQALKQQRDSARRQLQYTKRVLQEPLQPTASSSSSSSSLVHNNNNNNPSKASSVFGLTKKVISRRRASVDSVNLFYHHQDKNTKLNRRTSDLSFKASLAKTNRPSRLDLGMELKKIKEIVPLDEHNKDQLGGENVMEKRVHYKVLRDDSDFDIDLKKVNSNRSAALNYIRLPWNFIRSCWMKIPWNQEKVLNFINKWSGNSYMHALLVSCAILCFLISIFSLLNLFLQQESAMAFWLLLWNQTNNVNA